MNGVARSYLRDGAYVTDPLLHDGEAAYTPGASVREYGATKYLHSGLKSADAQSGSSQTLTATRLYDAFGNLDSSSGSWTGALGYGGPYGYQSASEGGLMLLGHRYYDPSTGRFLTRDPIKDGRNWYAYCDSAPLGYFDDTGYGKKKANHPNSKKHRVAGPSGKPKIHVKKWPSRGRAEEAARRESAKGKSPIEHPGHFHPQGPKGEKLPQHHSWFEGLPWADIGKGIVIAGGLIVVGGAVVLTGGSAAIPLAAAGGVAIVFLPGRGTGGF